ncbi:MAG: ABC transporter permease [Bacteroidales bacterium]|jgi:putative ABC transport system permease protein
MQNILKSTIRNFVRKPATNLINLIGLAVSLALVIILSLYSYSELTTDNFYKNADRVYLYGDNNKIYTPGILKDQIDLSVPGVESAVRIASTWEIPVFQVAGHDPLQSDLIFADEGFFRLFTCKIIEGDPEAAMKEPMSLVITKQLAEKLFGNEQAVGQLVKLNNSNELTVRAVIERPKENSCLSFNALTSVATQKVVQPNEGEFTEWGWSDFQTFLLLKDNTNPQETAKKITALFPENHRNDYKNTHLIPLKKIYFSKFELYGADFLHSGDKNKVLVLILVAALVLMIALINFVNISSSQWLDKIRQTGVMKVIGARQSAIFLNMLSETFVFFLSALFLAAFLAMIFIPAIQNYTGIHVNPKLMFSGSFLSIAIGASFILSFLFSMIPALRVSSSNALDNLKKNLHPQTGKSPLRGILVAAQFTIAIVLIAFTLLVQKQVNFGSSSFGFNQGNTIAINITPQLNQKKDVIRKILQDNPSVKRISMCQYYPGKTISQWGTQLETDNGKKQVNFDTFAADAEFFSLMGLQLVSGRFYSDDLSTDAGKVVVNESFLRENKIDNPIGTKLQARGGAEIIGVVKDFHYKSVNHPIAALAIRNDPYASYCLVNLQTPNFNSLHNTIQKIKKEITEFSPSFPVDIAFFDQSIEKMYQSELQFRRTFTLFASIAIVICCMGILAMSLFACQRRVKEIGIRKVNGARVSEVMTLLNKDFAKWVAIAFVIATPVAYYAMHKWLENFAYKTELSWWIFALAGLLALGIALLTVSWQSWKAATRNPVEALRYE